LINKTTSSPIIVFGCLNYQQPIFLSAFFVDMGKRKKYTAPVFT